MSDPIVPPADPPAGPGAPNGTPPAQPAKVEMTSDALTARLSEERAKGSAAARLAVLKELGIEDTKDGKALLAAAKAKADAELTETQRLTKALEELTPRAKRAEALEKQLEALVAVQFDALPEGTRSAIDEVAQGNAEERLRMIGVFRKAGFLDAPSGPPATPPPKTPPITTSPGSPPKPGATQTAWEKYQALDKTNPLLASAFYQTNRAAIDASRPAQ